MTKKILITGANGFTGRHLLPLLESASYEVIPMVYPAAGIKNEIPVDFCDDALAGILNQLPPVQAIVHLGTRVGWDGGTRDQLFKPNVLATALLADWAKKQDSHFIFASAALICGEKNTHIAAGCPVNTQNDYLYGKWLAEEMIKMSGVPHTLLRISGIFGKNGPHHLGLNRAIDGAINGIPPARYGDGLIKRNYIYVKDLCNTILYCIQNRVEGTHLTAGTHVDTLAVMLQTICDILLPGQSPETRPGEGYSQVVDPSPSLPETRTFEQAIRDLS